MSEGLYSSCAEVLSIAQSFKDDLAAILDPESGYAPRMRQVCEDQIEELEDRPDSRTLRDEIEVLRLEQNTWGLLQAVMPARKTDPPHTQSAKDLLLDNPYTPTSTLAQAILQVTPLLSELIVVREWLQETAPTPAPPEANTGYWKFTKHTIMQSLRIGHTLRDSIVSEMDPDVVNRGDGTALAADDSSYEKSLLQALYGYVRAGRLDDAVEVCRRAHQPWRAASIRGSLLFQWKALSTERRDEDSDEEDSEPEAWSGNRNRKLWKSMCIRAALSPALSDQERLLYASMVPSPQTTSILKSACRTWEDHLWADISVMCEEKASRELARLATGSFWEGGVDALEKGVDELRNLQVQQDDDEWDKEVVRTLESLKSIAVLEGPPADHAFHFAQLYIILERTDALLDVFAGGLQDGTYSPATFEYDAMCRFFAHLCLFLQMIDVPVPPRSTQIILESYLGVLEEAGQRDLIALYAGALGDNAVERYAAFLVSLALSADFTERRLALTRASEHGLDVERVAVVTAERTIEKAFGMLPTLKEPLPSIITLQPPPNESEMFLLRSIEWTTFMESTYDVALEQATVILRYFLGAGRVQAAQSLLSLLPVELASIAEPEEVATEYLHYRQFFVIWETIARVVECQAQESTFTQGPGTTRETKAAWVADYRGLIDQAHDQIMKLLTTEWLVSDVDDIGGDRRRRELIRIRQIYVPELILRLHYLLYSSRKLIPENLKRALELANVVADSRYKLYEDFMNDGGRSLAEYLGAVRQAILAGLEHGGSDPFRIVFGP
ncbi:nuclear pore protein 84/107 [Flammula alnicola]|nr:nuclear pore protein 84/107 [Flammula alnicola]